MSIDTTRLTNSINSGAPERNALLPDSQASVNVGVADKPAATTVRISQLAQHAIGNESQLIDMKRVNKIRQQLDSGTYQYDFGKIADTLLRDIIES